MKVFFAFSVYFRLVLRTVPSFSVDAKRSAASAKIKSDIDRGSYLVLGKTDSIFICGLDFEQGQPDLIAKLPVDLING
ncbi:hypothetical protein R1flu_003144 [Riccia fluitans]|uniref:Uncharacterized protein n=1 Tax=Riccia fluitans TaxID=41844 RepID=A0ABD1YBX3_9MARC